MVQRVAFASRIAVEHHPPGTAPSRKFNQLFVEIFGFVYFLQEPNIKLYSFLANNILRVLGPIFKKHRKRPLVFKLQFERDKCILGANHHFKRIEIHFSPWNPSRPEPSRRLRQRHRLAHLLSQLNGCSCYGEDWLADQFNECQLRHRFNFHWAQHITQSRPVAMGCSPHLEGMTNAWRLAWAGIILSPSNNR